jgi:hypothetical protein
MQWKKPRKNIVKYISIGKRHISTLKFGAYETLFAIGPGNFLTAQYGIAQGFQQN